ncbi:MAG: Histone deacetylase-like amidohydrolase [Planctomycetota bacterium]|jgi:acetoin utilization deacetylase AcuC-like enzyme
MTLIFSDSRFLLHQTGKHPECPERLRAIERHFAATGLLDRAVPCAVKSADEADLLAVHGSDYLEELHSYSAAGGGQIEADTVVSGGSAEVAWLAAGTAVEAVRRVLSGDDTTAFCAVRPPGHHALASAPMGFCLLGNAAVAARAAVRRFGLSRVLVVDWDVHHGNGTQDIFYDDSQVGFFSAHRFPFYPGTGRRQETGAGDGLGTTFNLPVEYGTSRQEFLRSFGAMLSAAADRMRPELVIVSAGFDAHAEDPVGSLGLETEDFIELTKMVQDVADTHAQGRIVSVLEGGYHVERLAECAGVHLQTLLEHSVDQVGNRAKQQGIR